VVRDLHCDNEAGVCVQAMLMKRTATMVLVLLGSSVCADPPLPQYSANDPLLNEQQFMREYILGVHRHRIPGGRLYGWKLDERWTLGRFKGENDDFGFGFELNHRDQLEFTNGGVRWRRSIGGPSHR